MGRRKEDISLPSPITPEDPSFKSLGIKHWFGTQHALSRIQNQPGSRRTQDEGHVMWKIQIAQDDTTPQALDSQIHNWVEEAIAAGAFMTLEDKIKAEQQWEAETETVPLSYGEPESRYSIDESWLTESVISEEDLVGFHEETPEDLEQEEHILYERDVVPQYIIDNDRNIDVRDDQPMPEEDPFVDNILLREGANLDPLKWQYQACTPKAVVKTNGYSEQSKSISEEDYSQESWA